MSGTDDDRHPADGGERVAAEFGVLLETGRRLAETLDMPTILQAAVDGITGLVGLDTAAVYLLEGEMLRLWATFPPLPEHFPDELRHAPLSDHPHVAASIRDKTHTVVEDLPHEALTEAEREVARQRNLRTVLYVPMLVEKDVIGAFIVGSTEEVVAISETRTALAQALANLSALTVRNAMLFEEEQQRSLELRQALAARARLEEERKTLQRQLAQAQKLESIGRLAGGVAHDFNNMLHVIQGYTELAMTMLPAEEPARAHLEEVFTAAERSAEITRQLLAFARKQTIAPREIDLNRSVANMLKMLKRLVGEDLDLVWAPADEPLPVYLDPSQLDRVLANLCVNARDAIQGVGKVTIATRGVTVDDVDGTRYESHRAGDYCLLTVSDDGRGFDDEVRDNLFDPFFTTKEDGTGLGLAMVYGIVKQNEGFIEVDSEPGRGTTFSICLPRHAGETDVGTVPPRVGRAAAGGETILVVEDDDSIRNLVALALTRMGYEVVSAGSPQQALARIADSPGRTDLLITDVVMPGTNGRELARQMTESHPDLKVLFISGYTSDVIAKRGVLDDDVHFLQKPFGREELADKVRSVLDGKLPG